MNTTATRRTDADLLGDAAATLRTGGSLALTAATVVEAMEAGDLPRALRVLAALAQTDSSRAVSALGYEVLACVAEVRS